jgi:hypothetical protein
MLTRLSYETNLGAFDACVKAGVGNATLVGKLLLPRCPEMDTFLQTLSPGAFCSLSAGSDSEKSSGLEEPCWSFQFHPLLAVTRPSPQTTEASPCAVRTRERTNGCTAIRKEVPATDFRLNTFRLCQKKPGQKDPRPGAWMRKTRAWLGSVAKVGHRQSGQAG